jgi:fructose-specific phosphotransferase system IIC component
MMRIPSRFIPLLFPFFMSLVMAFIMTAFITWINTGLADGYVGRWMHSFLLAWPLAMACIVLFANRIRTMTSKLSTQ